MLACLDCWGHTGRLCNSVKATLAVAGRQVVTLVGSFVAAAAAGVVDRRGADSNGAPAKGCDSTSSTSRRTVAFFR